ncbi:hypothetical protein ILYODFUR_014064 [Ilyodon furcidens]|uniref:Uncharacterized protein n=1 Tax=Ilyodon furcidens TaxID=33524 RepID=A0ABV0TVN9_9TELE
MRPRRHLTVDQQYSTVVRLQTGQKWPLSLECDSLISRLQHRDADRLEESLKGIEVDVCPVESDDECRSTPSTFRVVERNSGVTSDHSKPAWSAC